MAELLLPPPRHSWLKVLEKLPEEKRVELNALLQDEEILAAHGDWLLKARREQMQPPGDWWYIWLIMAGRGFGKNFSGSNWLIDQHLHHEAQNSVIVAATANDLRDYCIEGDSGVLNQAPDYFRPEYKPSKNSLEWPNGTKTTLRTSEKPARLRGGNFDRAWCDELAHWSKPKYCWDMLQFALRLGKHVKVLVTTTPRPIDIVKELVAREGKDAVITRGSTYDNIENLSTNYVEKVIKPFEGTTLGRQELDGEILMDVDGALWNHTQLEALRELDPPLFTRICVGVDPAITSSDKSNETGIIVAGVDANKNGGILADYTVSGSPDTWARRAVAAYHEFKADFIVAEANQGGDMVTSIIKNIDPTVPVKLVRASRGKVSRAEPVSALYEQGKIKHYGMFARLEDQMCMFVPGDLKESPDRVDAMVWAITELMLGGKKGRAGLWPGRK